VEVCIDIAGVRVEEGARIGVWVLLQALFEVFEGSPVGFAGHLCMFAESLVRRPVFFLMIAAAVENYEATFAGVEASLGFANCALIFVWERGRGRHLGCIVWLSKENDKFGSQVSSWVVYKQRCCGVVDIELASSGKRFLFLCVCTAHPQCNTVDAVENQVFIRWCRSDANAMQLRCLLALRRK
jgi:hypothetical protein